MMHLLTDLWKLLSMNFHELMHMSLVGAQHQTIPPLKKKQDGRDLDNLKGEDIIIMGKRRL